jgi:hypothetical protein
MPKALFATIHKKEPVTWTCEEIKQLIKQSGFYNLSVISYTIKTDKLTITNRTGSSPDLASSNNNNHHDALTTATYIADPAKDIVNLDTPLHVDSLLHNRLILACQGQITYKYSSIDTYKKTHSTRPTPTYIAETDEPSTYYTSRKFHRNGRGGFRFPHHDQYTHSQLPRFTTQPAQQCFMCKKKGMG